MLADSPLTSIFFAKAYSDVSIINDILLKRGKEEVYQFALTDAHLKFFDDKNISLDQKIALINALGWGTSNNIIVMKNHLAKKYTLEALVIDSILQEPLYENQEFYAPAQNISYDDLTMLAYVQVMHDYFNPMLGMQCAYRAALNNEASEATTYILAFILAQYYLDMDWCSIYPVFASARDAGSYTKDQFRKEAVSAMFEYVDLYMHICDEEYDEEMIEEQNPALSNDIYTELHWQQNPVYVKPGHQLISDKKNKVDLELLNKRNDNEPMYNSWILYDEESNGTALHFQIKNNGNKASIETNLEIVIDNSQEFEGAIPMYIQRNIPPIEPNETIELELIIPDYWIYDPNADFKIILDLDNNIIETNEKNNIVSFHEFG